MEAEVKESTRQIRLLVRQYMGEARVEIPDDVPLPEEGTVLRHNIDLSQKEMRFGDVKDRLARVFGLSLPELRCEGQHLQPEIVELKKHKGIDRCA